MSNIHACISVQQFLSQYFVGIVSLSDHASIKNVLPTFCVCETTGLCRPIASKCREERGVADGWEGMGQGVGMSEGEGHVGKRWAITVSRQTDFRLSVDQPLRPR